MTKQYIPGTGYGSAKILILGESPSHEELKQGKPFVGPSGRELDNLLSESGISRSDCWLTNVCKYYVTPNQGKKKIPFHIRAKNDDIDLDKEVSDLKNEIESINPNVILALGGTALWALSGKKPINSYRGSIMQAFGKYKFVPTYHPAHLLHQASGEFKGYWNREIMLMDMKRALRQSSFPELRLPGRILEICRSSAHLSEFLNKWKHRTRVAVDIESLGTCIPGMIGFAFDKSHGMSIPLWNANNISNISDSDLIQIYLIVDYILQTYEVIGHNFNYDRDKLKRLGFTIKKYLHDTMLKAQAYHPELPKNLAFWTSVVTEEPFYKDDGMYHGKIEDLFIGNAKDACVTYEIDEILEDELIEINQMKYYRNFLMKLPDAYWEIEQTGFKINEEKRKELLHKYIVWDERIRYELFTLVGYEVNVNSPKQVATLLWETWNLPRKDSTGEEEITELLNSPTAVKNAVQRKVLELILEGRRVRKTISTYIMALADYDGRMKTTYFLCLDTGRTATSPLDPPIRPSIELRDENNKKKNKSIGIAFQTMTKHGDIGQDVRSMYVPG